MDQKKGKILIFILFFVFILAVLAGLYFYFFYFSPSKDPDLTIEFQAKESNYISGVNEYVFTFRNLQTRTILSPEINLFWPADFDLIESIPPCDKKIGYGCYWEIKDFSPFKKAKVIVIRGRFLETSSLEKEFRGSLYFKVPGLSSEFKKDFNFSTKLKKQPGVILEADLPELIKQKDISGRVVVKNLLNQDLDDLELLVKSDEVIFSNNEQSLVFNFRLNGLEEKAFDFQGEISSFDQLSSIPLEFIVSIKKDSTFFPQFHLVRNLGVDL